MEYDDGTGETIDGGEFPLPKICDGIWPSQNLDTREDEYFCPWDETIGLSCFEDLIVFYSGPNSDYVKIDEENETIYLRPRSRARALPDFILEARWLDYIGKMTVDEEGIYLSFSGEYAEEAAKLE